MRIMIFCNDNDDKRKNDSKGGERERDTHPSQTIYTTI